jgi:hypothetical protein
MRCRERLVDSSTRQLQHSAALFWTGFSSNQAVLLVRGITPGMAGKFFSE